MSASEVSFLGGLFIGTTFGALLLAVLAAGARDDSAREDLAGDDATELGRIH